MNVITGKNVSTTAKPIQSRRHGKKIKKKEHVKY